MIVEGASAPWTTRGSTLSVVRTQLAPQGGRTLMVTDAASRDGAAHSCAVPSAAPFEADAARHLPRHGQPFLACRNFRRAPHVRASYEDSPVGEPDQRSEVSAPAEEDRQMDATDVLAVAEQCAQFLAPAADADWGAPIPGMEWSVAQAIAHAAEAPHRPAAAVAAAPSSSPAPPRSPEHGGGGRPPPSPHLSRRPPAPAPAPAQGSPRRSHYPHSWPAGP